MERNHLTIRIQSIKALNNEVVNIGGKVINPRRVIWNRYSDYKNQSLPTVFLTNNKMPAQLEALVEVEGAAAGKDYELEATSKSGEVIFSGITNISDERCSNVRFLLDCCQSFKWFSTIEDGALFWQLNALNGSDKSTKDITQLQVYWLKSAKANSPLRRKGIPAELLQQMAKNLPAVILEDPNLIYNLANNIFNYQPPRYDIYQGAPHFGNYGNWNNITLHYNAYVHAHNYNYGILNCYDAAAVLQYILVLNGYAYPSTQYCYMQPFGYLRYTNLIGQGNCNNPFFGATGGPPVINPYDSTRTSFGNHAFCYYQPYNWMLDSCAGPHTGGETPFQYVDNATDDLYPNPPRTHRGSVNNITFHVGVTYVNFVLSQGDISELSLPHLEAFKTAINFDKKTVTKIHPKYVVGNWPIPTSNHQIQQGNWKLGYEEVLPGQEEALKIWHLNKGESTILLKLYVASKGNKLSYNRFLSIGALAQTADLPYENGPEDLGHYSAISHHSDSQRCFWVFHNVVMEITSINTGLDIIPLARWYFDWANRHLKEDLRPYCPNFDLLITNPTPKAGELFSITNTSDGAYQLEFLTDDYNNLRLVAENLNTLTFEALEPSKNTLQLMLVNQESLLLSNKEIDVEVV